MTVFQSVSKLKLWLKLKPIAFNMIALLILGHLHIVVSGQKSKIKLWMCISFSLIFLLIHKEIYKILIFFSFRDFFFFLSKVKSQICHKLKGIIIKHILFQKDKYMVSGFVQFTKIMHISCHHNSLLNVTNMSYLVYGLYSWWKWDSEVFYLKPSITCSTMLTLKKS